MLEDQPCWTGSRRRRLAALDSLRVKLLGKSGEITAQSEIARGDGPGDARRRGAKIHALREQVTGAHREPQGGTRGGRARPQARDRAIDLTLLRRCVAGTIHPVSQVMDELAEIFADLGFSVAEGPEIETNGIISVRSTRPRTIRRARCRTGSMWSRGGRTRNRASCAPTRRRYRSGRWKAHGAPLYVIAPGRVYRSDSDATHTPMFHQVEGLVIDRDITLGHLKWTLETFLKAFFERDDVVLRMRPSYFPFTEPSAEVDVGWSIENGRRVVGGQQGWMEVLGSGMVHPRVIASCGLDPEEWQGFAFGCGIDRLAMLKYGMDDLRAFFDGDIRWLKHYGFRALDVPTLSGGVGA